MNPSTGYRYYSGEQVPTAQVIRRLRDLEMPVSEVKAVLDAPDALARNALIAAHLGRLEAELAQTRAAVDSLRNLLRPPVDAPAIEHRSVPATRAAGHSGGRRPRGQPALVAGCPGRTARHRPRSGPARDRSEWRGVRERAVPARPGRGHRVHPGGRQRARYRAGHAGRDPGGRASRHHPSGLARRRRSQLRHARFLRHQARDQRRRAAARVLPARRQRHTGRGGMEDRDWLAHLPRRRQCQDNQSPGDQRRATSAGATSA